MRHTIPFLLALLAFVGCKSQPSPTTPVDTTGSAASVSYSLDENIGEMLLLGFRGTKLGSDNHIVSDLQRYHVGAVILFDYDAPSGKRGRNIKDPEQLRRLCQQLRKVSPSLLIGIDQEGGSVSRLCPRNGFPRVASPKQSALQGDDSVRWAASTTASMLASVGIDLNFAPVADVDVNPACPVIGALGRSFSADEKRVAECCRIWIEEMNSRGIVSCMKHFPGHGSAASDTHKGMADVSHSFQDRELYPYRELAREVPMVMMAHIVNTNLDKSGLPASLSASMVSLLRDTMGFDGVIVTDDLAMGAISKHYSLRETLERAINAGADMLCLSNNGSQYDPELARKAVETIKQLVAEGKVDSARIEQSAARIRALKARMQ